MIQDVETGHYEGSRSAQKSLFRMPSSHEKNLEFAENGPWTADQACPPGEGASVKVSDSSLQNVLPLSATADRLRSWPLLLQYHPPVPQTTPPRQRYSCHLNKSAHPLYLRISYLVVSFSKKRFIHLDASTGFSPSEVVLLRRTSLHPQPNGPQVSSLLNPKVPISCCTKEQ